MPFIFRKNVVNDLFFGVDEKGQIKRSQLQTALSVWQAGILRLCVEIVGIFLYISENICYTGAIDRKNKRYSMKTLIL